MSLYNKLGLTNNGGKISVNPNSNVFVKPWGSTNGKGPYQGHSSVKSKTRKRTRKA